jgi:hypothetical protein
MEHKTLPTPKPVVGYKTKRPASDEALVRALRRDAAPRREPVSETQINIRLTHEDATAYRDLCWRERLTYGEMLRVLMAAWEERGQGG